MKVTKVNLLVSIALMVVGPSIFLLMPLYIGAISDSYGYSAGNLGLLASADLIGVGIASLLAPLWINKVSWRSTVVWMWLAFIVGNCLSVTVIDYNALFSLRLMIGLTAGVALSIATSIISLANNPGRFFAIGVFLQVSYQTVSFIILPDIISEFQVQGILFYIVGLQLVISPLLYFIPVQLKPAHHAEDVQLETVQSRRDCYHVLAAMGLFFVCQAGVFAFVDLIGNGNGLDDNSVGLALSISTFIGLAGPLLAVIVGERFGRFKPILLAACCQLLVLFLFDFASGLVAYTALLAIFQLCWNFSLGFQFSALVAVDKNNRFASMVPAAQAAGIALGPILAGNALEVGGNQAIYLLCAIALSFFIILVLPRNRVSQQSSSAETKVI